MKNRLLSVEKSSRDEAIKISPKQILKIYNLVIIIYLTLTYSILLYELVNVALSVEHRCADLEERDTSA